MPFEHPYLSAKERAAYLNSVYRGYAAIPVLREALQSEYTGKTALVSSFGAESVILLHMVSIIAPDTPVLFIDTNMLFQETLDYQLDVSASLGLTNVQKIKASKATISDRDPVGLLHKADVDACCALRKSEPLQQALEGYDTWITGRKRFQSDGRKHLLAFEAETETRLKLNPLAKWRPEDVQEYLTNNRLPRHPLVAKGYPSIGCAPCTSKVSSSADQRSGRWQGSKKSECGIHFGPDGAVRKAKQ